MSALVQGHAAFADQQYSSLAGFTFLFNVIMGTGPLTLPAAFQQAGWLTGIIVLIILCFMSFITFTYTVEALSITNAVFVVRKSHCVSSSDSSAQFPNLDRMLAVPAQHVTESSVSGLQDSDDATSLRQHFNIVRKFELGDMFTLYFGRTGNILFYLVISVYLYGDLSIYAAGVPKSFRDVVCTSSGNDSSIDDYIDLCWTFSSLSRFNVYRICVVCFAACMLPFLFFHVTRSRWLQLITTALRWISFLLMFCLAIDRAIVIRRQLSTSDLTLSRLWNPALHPLILQASEPAVIPKPPLVRAQGIPNLFGVCVYAFMCHHSIPGLVTPIRNKKNIILRVFIPLFLCVLSFNLLLSGTAVAAFDEIKDLYTLNFVPSEQSAVAFGISYTLAKVFGYFLSLFPVFALSSTFPILCCTLLGNLHTLVGMCTTCRTPVGLGLLRWTLPFVVILPPVCVALWTANIGFLVGFTGAFAGSAIQYIIPALLVYRARSYFFNMLTIIDTCSSSDDSSSIENEEATELLHTHHNEVGGAHFQTGPICSVIWSRFVWLWTSSRRLRVPTTFASPFQHFVWILLLIVWSVFCIIIVLVDKIHPL